jgi:hypothetical protein
MNTDSSHCRLSNQSLSSGCLSSIFGNQKIFFSPEKDSLEKKVATAKAKLPFEEIQAMQHDLHGVPEIRQEDNVSRDGWLKDLNQHLNRMKHRRVYEVAEAMDRSYVSDKEFQMMFIRAAEYNPMKAAQRILEFFEFKQSLFGNEMLVKEITLDNLSETDKKHLKRGNTQILPMRDMTGRHVIFNNITEMFADEIRSRYYLWMSLFTEFSSSIEAQQKGIVSVVFGLGMTSASHISDQVKLVSCLPIRPAAVHCCTVDHMQYIMMNSIHRLLPMKLQALPHFHNGSKVECKYSLSAFGIFPQAIPFSDEGQLQVENHLLWYNRCQNRAKSMEEDLARSASVSPTSMIEKLYPESYDILLGHGRLCHPGNIHLQMLIDSQKDNYYRGVKKYKVKVIDDILKTILRSGGRFLKLEPESVEWKEIGFLEARKKVAKGFHNAKRKSMKAFF